MATPYELFAPSFNDRFNAAPATDTYDPSDPTYAGMDAGTRQQAIRNLATMMPEGQPPKAMGSRAPLLNGPQQSYANASNLQASNDGVSGQAGRMESSYNNSPYRAPQGTIGNTGQPQAQSQGELTGQGGQGWNIYQTTPTWTGSPNSQSPPARDEGDFKPPPISGPQNPVLQRQQALRQQLIARAFQSMPRGYQFKLG